MSMELLGTLSSFVKFCQIFFFKFPHKFDFLIKNPVISKSPSVALIFPITVAYSKIKSELRNYWEHTWPISRKSTSNVRKPSKNRRNECISEAKKSWFDNTNLHLKNHVKPGLSGIFPSKIFDTAKSVIERMSDNKTNDDNGIISLEEAQSPTSAEDLECLLCHKYIMSRIRGKISLTRIRT